MSAQSTTHIPDEEIVRKVIDGDKEWYGVLFERYQGLIYRRALLMLGDCDMALDIVQEAFLIGYKNLERLRDPTSFAFWIGGIARNLCSNVKRSWKSHTVSLDYLAEVGVEPAEPEGNSTEKKERMEAVKKLLPQLPAKYREILELRYGEGYSCKRIANFLKLSESAVKSRLFYARKHILKKLEKEGW